MSRLTVDSMYLPTLPDLDISDGDELIIITLNLLRGLSFRETGRDVPRRQFAKRFKFHARFGDRS